MRQFSLGEVSEMASVEEKLDWIINSLREIERAQYEARIDNIADAYTLTNLPSPLNRTLSAAETNATNIAEVLATFLHDIQERKVEKA